MPTGHTIKDKSKRLFAQLPDDAFWEDLIYRVNGNLSIEAGLRDS